MNSKTYIVVASAIMLLVCIVYQGSYSYFTASATGGESVTEVPSATVEDLVITNGDGVTSNDLLPGESITRSFSVENPNDVSVCFNLKWNNVVNTFVNQKDLVYTLTDSKGSVVSDIQFPADDTAYLVTGRSLAGNYTETYTLTVTYVNTDENQMEDIGKTFGGTIIGELGTCA